MIMLPRFSRRVKMFVPFPSRYLRRNYSAGSDSGEPEVVPHSPSNTEIIPDSTSDGGKKKRRRNILPRRTMEEKLTLLEPHLGFRPQIGVHYPQLPHETIKHILSINEKEVEQALFDYANTITEHFYEKKVFFRGIIEFSNVCTKNCFYCGIRKDTAAVNLHRYTMKPEEIVEAALWAHHNQYGSIMLQSGELPTEKRIQMLCDVIREIKDKTGHGPEGLAVALSLGELSREQYQQLLDAGAHRYLLRIETSNPELYAKLHPPNHLWSSRKQCLDMLKDLKYQVGTGVMIKLPYQTLDDLANDILFFRDQGVDMVGMGPYIVQHGTPLGKIWTDQNPNVDIKAYNKELFGLSLKMIAITRIVCGDINIAATTALQAINPVGREIALLSGANMVMPIITPTKYRIDYQLYEGKPCIDDTAEECKTCLSSRLKWAGKDLMKSAWGDSLSAKGKSHQWNQ